MKRLLALFFAFVLLPCLLTQEQDVLIINQNNLQTILSSFDYVLVNFCVPRFEPCHKLYSEFSAAAAKLKKLKKSIALAYVNGDENQNLANTYMVTSYPTFKFFAVGLELQYKGGDTEDEIYKWMRFRVMASTKLLNNMEHVEEMTEINDMIIIYFGVQGPSFDIYEKATKTYDLHFSHYFDEGSENKVVIYVKNATFVYNPEVFEFHDLRNFINRHQPGVVLPMDKYNAYRIFDVFKPGLIVFLDDSVKSDQVLENVKTLLNENYEIKEKFIAYNANYKEDYPRTIMDLYGVQIEDLPQVRIVIPQHQNSKDIHKYEPLNKNDYSVNALLIFCNMFLSNSLTKVLKSEPIPINQNDNRIKVVVGKTFESIVYDKTKHVLVMFYSPWCHHCHQFEPTYQLLAEKVSADPNVILAKIDGTKNDIDGLPVTSYPTIKLFPANNKRQPIDFLGSRDLPRLIDFLKIHANLNLNHQEKPKIINLEGVIELSQFNFDEIVYQSDKPVLLNIFGEQCGYCTQLEPVYRDLAKEIKNLGYDVLITKIDGVKNKVPNFDVKGLPTILLYRKENKRDVIEYQGDRSVNDFIRFIRINAFSPNEKLEIDDAMIKVNNRNFDEHVYNEKNDFVLFIYRNRHDTSINEVVKKLKKEFENSDYKHVSFGLIDIGINPLPKVIDYQIKLKDLPTAAIFIKHYKKSPTQYFGDVNDLQEVKKFIVRESSFTIIQHNPDNGKKITCNENHCKEEL